MRLPFLQICGFPPLSVMPIAKFPIPFFTYVGGVKGYPIRQAQSGVGWGLHPSEEPPNPSPFLSSRGPPGSAPEGCPRDLEQQSSGNIPATPSPLPPFHRLPPYPSLSFPPQFSGLCSHHPIKETFLGLEQQPHEKPSFFCSGPHGHRPGHRREARMPQGPPCAQ